MLVLLGVLSGGCGQPQIEAEHRNLLLGLATATSARDPRLLDEVAGLIEAERAAGRLAPATDEAFAAIVAPARDGDWDRATRRAYAIRDAQEPTAADLERLERRELPEPKLPPGARPKRSSGAH